MPDASLPRSFRFVCDACHYTSSAVTTEAEAKLAALAHLRGHTGGPMPAPEGKLR